MRTSRASRLFTYDERIDADWRESQRIRLLANPDVCDRYLATINPLWTNPQRLRNLVRDWETRKAQQNRNVDKRGNHDK